MTYPDYIIAKIDTLTENQARWALRALTLSFSKLSPEYSRPLVESVDRIVQAVKDRS